MSETTPPRDLAVIAWNAYRREADGKSLVTGSPIPAFLRDAPERVQDAWGAAADAVAAEVRAHAGPELAAAMAESRKVRDVVCRLLDLFGQPDDRRMRHASITAATLDRYAAEAGVKP